MQGWVKRFDRNQPCSNKKPRTDGPLPRFPGFSVIVQRRSPAYIGRNPRWNAPLATNWADRSTPRELASDAPRPRVDAPTCVLSPDRFTSYESNRESRLEQQKTPVQRPRSLGVQNDGNKPHSSEKDLRLHYYWA